jgi:hypothetical protein
MSETTPRSSVLYSLGRLEGKVEDHTQALAALPAQVAAAITPRLLALEISDRDQNKRLTALERRQWIWIGGGGVLIVLTGYVVNLVTPLHLIH